MSNLKIVDDLFLEKQELKRLVSFFTKDGYEMDLLHNAEKFGVIKNSLLDPTNRWLSLEPSNTLGIAKFNKGFAYDKNHKRITLPEDILLTIPDDNLWYWLRIQHTYTSIEKGKISIGGTNGALMTGVDTKFTEILRGQPNFPTKIRFVNSLNYNLEYEVLEVIDDNNVLVQGVFETLEQDLQYIVVGTFTPGYYPPTGDKDIYEYDYIDYTLLQEGSNGEIPSFLENVQFLVSRVKNNAGTLEIQDKRHLCQFKTRAENLLNDVDRKSNPLIAIESVKKFNFNNDIFYTINVDWKFNIDNQNLNTTLRTTTITAGSGGKYKTISDFVEGDFDNWRYYYESGEYSRVLKSIKNADQTITLILDNIKIESGIGVSVCPNADEIGIVLNYEVQPNKPYVKDFKYFPINKQSPTIVVDENQLFKLNQFCDVKWFYKSGQETSQIYEFNENQYFIEAAFNKQGDLVDNTKTLTKQDIYFNGGVSPGITDGWVQFYPNQYSLMYGNNERVIAPATVASKLYYKFFGSNTVKIQGKINLTLTNDPTVNGGLAPNGVLFTNPFTWFDDTVGNRFIRSFVGGLRYKSATQKTMFELVRTELFYTPSNTTTGEDTPTNKICLRYLKSGVGELSDAGANGNVLYDNPLPTGTSLEFDVDMMIYFDSFDENYVNGPVGTDNTNPNVASGGLPALSNYTIQGQIGGGSTSFNLQLARNNSEINYRAKVDFLVEYRSRQQNQYNWGWGWWGNTHYWYSYYDRTVGGSVTFEITELNKNVNVPISDIAYDIKNIKITGVTLL